MRLYRYHCRCGDTRFGTVVDGRLLTGAAPEKRGGLPTPLTHLGVEWALAYEPDWRQDVERATKRAMKRGARPRALADRRPAAAIVAPGKGVCAGLNYGDHVAEGSRARPEAPVLFAKFANAVIGDGDPIVRPEGTAALDL